MNAIVLKNNLKEGLSMISGALKESSNLPILKNFLLEARNDKLKLASTDLEIGITYFISAKIIQEGSVVVPFSVFSQIINNLTSERISIEAKGTALLITTDNYKAKITTASKDEYPIIPDIKNKKENWGEFDSGYLIEALSSVVSACQISTIRPELSGILHVFRDNEVKIAATDSFRLAEKTISGKKFENHFAKETSFIVPLRTVTEVVRIFSAANIDKITVVCDKHQIVFEDDRVRMVSRLIEGKFPDYELIIPKSFDTEVVIDKNDLTGALKLSSSLTNRLNEVKFVTDENLKNVTIFSSSQEFGESEYLLPAKIKGESARVTFNWRFVLDGLKNIKSSNVFVGFNGEDKPSMIKSTDDASYVYILMPIKSS